MAPGKTGSAAGNAPDAVEDFLNYMKETPAQRMEDAWLHQHGLTRQQLAAMSPEDRKKIMAQMKQEIELRIKQATETKANGKNILVAL